MTIVRVFFAGLLVFATCRPSAGQSGSAPGKFKFDTVEVDRLDVGEGVSCPVDFLVMLQEDLVKRLGGVRSVKEVLHPNETPSQGSRGIIRVMGTVTYFSLGNPGLFLAFGAGEGEIDVDVKLVDASSGRLLTTEKIRGLGLGPGTGLGSGYLTQDFARKAASAMDVLLEVGAPETAGMAGSYAEGQGSSTERRTAHIVAVNVRKAEDALNTALSPDFALVGVDLVGGRNVNVILQKRPDGQEALQYRLVLADGRGDLEKQLNKNGKEGFRLMPNTLMPEIIEGLDVFMEKPQASSPARFVYRVYEKKHISDIRSSIETASGNGFNFVGAAEINSGTIVILESRH